MPQSKWKSPLSKGIGSVEEQQCSCCYGQERVFLWLAAEVVWILVLAQDTGTSKASCSLADRRLYWLSLRANFITCPEQQEGGRSPPVSLGVHLATILG